MYVDFYYILKDLYFFLVDCKICINLYYVGGKDFFEKINCFFSFKLVSIYCGI